MIFFRKKYHQIFNLQIVIIFGLVQFFISSCNIVKKDTLFETVLPSHSGVDFINKVEDTDEMNIFNYRNFYNGGGIAIGDINNDNLPDVYLVANTGKNKLYLNKGNMIFEDISKSSATEGAKAFSTGAVMADVNGDGLLDIYVCNSGELKNDDRANELFINNGDLTFTEKAKEYGLNDKGYSTHAAFFDYDADGDLDMFLLENSSYPVNKLGYKNLRNQRDSLGGQKLFRNNSMSKNNKTGNGKLTMFSDVSKEAGIFGSLIGFGLGISIGDVNNDMFPDIYISNDFYERDYLYINQRNGTFLEDSKNQMGHISYSSMGADIADINNDGNLDIFSTDMLPLDDYRLKTTMVYEDYNLSKTKFESDFYHQFSRNMLQFNNGDNTFSEIGALAGVHATDWSWGALIFDMDNDGLKDLFVANGIYKNVTDQDFVSFLNDDATMQPYLSREKKFNYKDFMDKMSVMPISNYAFRNNGTINFTNEAKRWGLDKPSFTSGAAYGDLDNDGDLDLVLNNTNQQAAILKNRSVESVKTNFLKIKLKGNSKNTQGIGARLRLFADNKMQVLEQMPNRGFESSSDYGMVFGIGSCNVIDSLIITWYDQKIQKIESPKINSTIVLEHKSATLPKRIIQNNPQLFLTNITEKVKLNFEHKENYFIDYDRDGLLKSMYSRLGPGLAVGDINGDGREDVFLGSGKGEQKGLFVQVDDLNFKPASSASLPIDPNAEVAFAQFFDADNDKDLDLLVVTGGNDNFPKDPSLVDYLYLNDGKGNFMNDINFPQIFEAGASAAISDYDLDGDLDIFIGGRLMPAQYGFKPKHHFYKNIGKGRFSIEGTIINNVEKFGMITDAIWADLNLDKYPELIVTQDWGAITILENKKGKYLVPNEIGNTNGWWNRIKATDLDSDGDIDFIVGNSGRNSRIIANTNNPARFISGDFDRNGRVDQIISCISEDGNTYPMVLKNDLQKQIPSIKKKYFYYKDFAKKTLNDFFSAEDLENSFNYIVNQPNTGVLINEQGVLKFKELPVEAQYSPIHGIEIVDFNHDKLPDLLLTGNFFNNQTELGRYDANYGQIFVNLGKGNFHFIPNVKTGLQIRGQIRNSAKIKDTKGNEMIIFAKNSDRAQIFLINKNLK
jgi:enediyne biosynthesis protein E4